MGEATRKEQATHITDLPVVVLASIFAHLHNPADAIAVLATCRLFRAVLPTAPLRLRVTLLSNPLLSIRTHMRATRELDLSGCFVSDADVASLLQSLRSLVRLTLDNCQKLTGAAVDALAASGPRSVSLQRCFGLASTANLLKTSRIHTVLLSHVDHLHIPNVQQTQDFARSELRVLALNNCARLDVSEFLDVAILCPHLEFLFLGGSFLPGRDEILSSTLIRLIELLPRLRVLELTFFAAEIVAAIREHVHVWDFCELASVESARSEDAFGVRGAASCSDSRKRTPLHVAASRGDVGLVTALVTVGALVEMKDVSGSTALFLAAECGYAGVCEVLLRGGADVLANNKAGETPLYIAALKGHSVSLGVMLAHCSERGVNWLDAEAYGDGWTPLMAAAVAERRGVGEMLLEAAGFYTATSGGVGESVSAEGARVFVADQDDKRNGGELDTVNAGVLVTDQRDEVNGGVSMTVNAETAGVLVADQVDKGNGGESEIAIAGVLVAEPVNDGETETEAARVLVADQAHKINGGDSETVISDTAGILVADQDDKTNGGEKAGSTSQQLRRLLNRQNRYGQTALHIAAQKGSVWFIERLLTAGASLDIPNTYGFRAVDVAKRHKKTETADILRKWESKQAPSTKPSRKARRKKDKATLAESSSCFVPEQATD